MVVDGRPHPAAAARGLDPGGGAGPPPAGASTRRTALRDLSNVNKDVDANYSKPPPASAGRNSKSSEGRGGIVELQAEVGLLVQKVSALADSREAEDDPDEVEGDRGRAAESDEDEGAQEPPRPTKSFDAMWDQMMQRKVYNYNGAAMKLNVKHPEKIPLHPGKFLSVSREWSENGSPCYKNAQLMMISPRGQHEKNSDVVSNLEVPDDVKKAAAFNTAGGHQAKTYMQFKKDPEEYYYMNLTGDEEYQEGGGRPAGQEWVGAFLPPVLGQEACWDGITVTLPNGLPAPHLGSSHAIALVESSRRAAFRADEEDEEAGHQGGPYAQHSTDRTTAENQQVLLPEEDVLVEAGTVASLNQLNRALAEQRDNSDDDGDIFPHESDIFPREYEEELNSESGGSSDNFTDVVVRRRYNHNRENNVVRGEPGASSFAADNHNNARSTNADAVDVEDHNVAIVNEQEHSNKRVLAAPERKKKRRFTSSSNDVDGVNGNLINRVNDDENCAHVQNFLHPSSSGTRQFLEDYADVSAMMESGRPVLAPEDNLDDLHFPGLCETRGAAGDLGRGAFEEELVLGELRGGAGGTGHSWNLDDGVLSDVGRERNDVADLEDVLREEPEPDLHAGRVPVPLQIPHGMNEHHLLLPGAVAPSLPVIAASVAGPSVGVAGGEAGTTNMLHTVGAPRGTTSTVVNGAQQRQPQLPPGPLSRIGRNEPGAFAAFPREDHPHGASQTAGQTQFESLTRFRDGGSRQHVQAAAAASSVAEHSASEVGHEAGPVQQNEVVERRQEVVEPVFNYRDVPIPSSSDDDDDAAEEPNVERESSHHAPAASGAERWGDEGPLPRGTPPSETPEHREQLDAMLAAQEEVLREREVRHLAEGLRPEDELPRRGTEDPFRAPFAFQALNPMQEVGYVDELMLNPAEEVDAALGGWATGTGGANGHGNVPNADAMGSEFSGAGANGLPPTLMQQVDLANPMSFMPPRRVEHFHTERNTLAARHPPEFRNPEGQEDFSAASIPNAPKNVFVDKTVYTLGTTQASRQVGTAQFVRVTDKKKETFDDDGGFVISLSRSMKKKKVDGTLVKTMVKSEFQLIGESTGEDFEGFEGMALDDEGAETEISGDADVVQGFVDEEDPVVQGVGTAGDELEYASVAGGVEEMDKGTVFLGGGVDVGHAVRASTANKGTASKGGASNKTTSGGGKGKSTVFSTGNSRRSPPTAASVAGSSTAFASSIARSASGKGSARTTATHSKSGASSTAAKAQSNQAGAKYQRNKPPTPTTSKAPPKSATAKTSKSGKFFSPADQKQMSQTDAINTSSKKKSTITILCTETFSTRMFPHQSSKHESAHAMMHMETELQSPLSDHNKAEFRGKRWNSMTDRKRSMRLNVARLALRQKREWKKLRGSFLDNVYSDLYGNRRVLEKEDGTIELVHTRTRLLNVEPRSKKCKVLDFPDPFEQFMNLCANGETFYNHDHDKGNIHCPQEFSTGKKSIASGSSCTSSADLHERNLMAATSDLFTNILLFENVELLQEHDCLLNKSQQNKLKLLPPTAFLEKASQLLVQAATAGVGSISGESGELRGAATTTNAAAALHHQQQQQRLSIADRLRLRFFSREWTARSSRARMRGDLPIASTRSAAGGPSRSSFAGRNRAGFRMGGVGGVPGGGAVAGATESEEYQQHFYERNLMMPRHILGSKLLQKKALQVPSFLIYSYADLASMKEVLKYMDGTNWQKMLRADYLANKQACIRASHRTTLVDWLVEVTRAFFYRPACLELCVYLLDQYCANLDFPGIEIKYYQLVGATCLFLAVKLSEVMPMNLCDLTRLCDQQYVPQDFLDWECDICHKLDFNLLGYPSVVEYGGIFQALAVAEAVRGTDCIFAQDDEFNERTRGGNDVEQERDHGDQHKKGPRAGAGGRHGRDEMNHAPRGRAAAEPGTPTFGGATAAAAAAAAPKFNQSRGSTPHTRNRWNRHRKVCNPYEIALFECDNVATDPWWLFHARDQNGLLFTMFSFFCELCLHDVAMLDLPPKKRAAACLYCALCCLVPAEAERREQLKAENEKKRAERKLVADAAAAVSFSSFTKIGAGGNGSGSGKMLINGSTTTWTPKTALTGGSTSSGAGTASTAASTAKATGTSGGIAVASSSNTPTPTSTRSTGKSSCFRFPGSSSTPFVSPEEQVVEEGDEKTMKNDDEQTKSTHVVHGRQEDEFNSDDHDHEMLVSDLPPALQKSRRIVREKDYFKFKEEAKWPTEFIKVTGLWAIDIHKEVVGLKKLFVKGGQHRALLKKYEARCGKNKFEYDS
eukprot:g11559.t1